MAYELQFRYQSSGQQLYVVLAALDGQFWNADTPALETYTVANWGQYDIPLTESPSGGYEYKADMPGTFATGRFRFMVYDRKDVSPNIDNDTLVMDSERYWDGTSVLQVAPPETVVADSVCDEVLSGHSGAGSLGEALTDILADTGAIPTAAAIADAVLDEALSGHSGGGTFGAAVVGLQEDWDTDGRLESMLSNASAKASAIYLHTSQIGLAGAGLTGIPGFASLNDPSASAIADAVFDEVLSGHTNAGSVGKAITDILAQAVLITAGRMNSPSPQESRNNHRSLTAGDDYSVSSGKPFTVTKSGGAQWPSDLSGWSISLVIQAVTATSATIDKAGEIVTATGDDQSVRVALTAAETTTLSVGQRGYEWYMIATKDNERNTLASGLLSVLEGRAAA